MAMGPFKTEDSGWEGQDVLTVDADGHGAREEEQNSGWEGQDV